MTWIQTFTGKQFFPLTPDGAAVCIEDIAHALSMKCRFNGHCQHFYSVAEHSIRVANAVASMGGDRETRRAALLHDAAEAYLPDICRPIKPLVQIGATGEGDDVWTRSFSDAENVLMACVLGALDVGVGVDIDWDLIKRADNILLATEARDLMCPPPAAWKALPPPLIVPISTTLLPSSAKAQFLHEWRNA